MNQQQWKSEKSLSTKISPPPAAPPVDRHLAVVEEHTVDALTRREVHHQTCCDWAIPQRLK